MALILGVGGGGVVGKEVLEEVFVLSLPSQGGVSSVGRMEKDHSRQQMPLCTRQLEA